MPINPAYKPGDFTPEENIPDDTDDGSFSRPEDLPEQQPGTSSTQTPEEHRMQEGSRRTLSQREELKRSKIDDLYEHLGEELGLPNSKHYDDFELRGNQLLYDGVDITKKNGEFRSVSVIRKRLGTTHLRVI